MCEKPNKRTMKQHLSDLMPRRLKNQLILSNRPFLGCNVDPIGFNKKRNQKSWNMGPIYSPRFAVVALAVHPEKPQHTVTNVPALPAAVASAESLLHILPAPWITSQEATPTHMEYHGIRIVVAGIEQMDPSVQHRNNDNRSHVMSMFTLTHFTIPCIDFVSRPSITVW